VTSLWIRGETAYPPVVPSARVRLAQFVDFLHPHDIDLEYRPALTDEEYAFIASPASPLRKAGLLARATARAARHRGTPDLLLVHRLRAPVPFPGFDPPRRLDVYDLDDALFEGSTGDANRRFGWVKQEARRYLAERARTYAPRVEIVPSCVDPDTQPIRDHVDRETTTMGWIGSASTAQYLAPVLPVIRRLHENGAGVRLVVVGADTGMREPWIEHRPWSLARQASDLSGFDIGLMPLPDDAWARGKCGYKLLQYFSAGVPAVVSPVGVAPAMAADGRGATAVSAADWEREIRALSSSAAERGQRGARARAYADQEFSYRRWAPELASMLRTVA
jgi:glycosyltransferase involved in cell wall biosynthesis